MSKYPLSKCYAYQCIIYPDSEYTPFDWQIRVLKKAEQKNIRWVALSPAHDRSIGEDGETLKKHYHCIIKYRNSIVLETFEKDVEEFGGVVDHSKKKNDSVIADFKQALTYLVHKDKKSIWDDTKEKYDEKDIKIAGSMSLKRIKMYIEQNKAEELERSETMMAIGDFCEKNSIYGMWSLLKYCWNYNQSWHDFLMNKKNADYFKTHILQPMKWESDTSQIGVKSLSKEQLTINLTPEDNIDNPFIK